MDALLELEVVSRPNTEENTLAGHSRDPIQVTSPLSSIIGPTNAPLKHA